MGSWCKLINIWNLVEVVGGDRRDVDRLVIPPVAVWFDLINQFIHFRFFVWVRFVWFWVLDFGA